jgi:hypothetical protein
MGPQIETREGVFLFVHIPKTAGTSFRLAVEEVFPNRVLYDYGIDSARTSAEVRTLVHGEADLPRLAALLTERDIALLTGHVDYLRYAEIFPPKRVLTFVREPIARIVSEWQHVTRHYGFKGSLLQFAEKPRLRNVQTRMLRRARLRQLAFVGITERYTESLELLAERVGWRLRELKTNIKPESTIAVSEEELAQLRSWNAQDLRLYAKAQHRFERALRARERSGSGDSEAPVGVA